MQQADMVVVPMPRHCQGSSQFMQTNLSQLNSGTPTGVGALNLAQQKLQDIYNGRQAELEAGVDPDENEGVEYGDGGISSARHGNTSPTNGVIQAQIAPGSGAGNGATFNIQTIDDPDPMSL